MKFTERPSLPEAIRQRLLTGPLPGPAAQQRMAHAVRRAEPAPEAAHIREAAVLMTLYESSPGDWHMIFIKRSNVHVRDKHAGQIGFPGGKREPADPDLLYTALREAGEEISLDLSQVDVLGQLTPLYITVSKFMVHPFLAYSPGIPLLKRQEEEVEEIFTWPLRILTDPAVRTETRIRLHSGIVLNHVPAFQVGEQIIWGATAMILNELLEIVADPGH